MNIFAVDRDPYRAARALHDVHVVSQIGETHQILSDAAELIGAWRLPMRLPYNPHGRFARWVATSRSNGAWLLDHGLALCEEKRRRYGTPHVSEDALLELGIPLLSRLPIGSRTKFAMDERTSQIARACSVDAVQAYRALYSEKLRRQGRAARWTLTRPPAWLHLG